MPNTVIPLTGQR